MRPASPTSARMGTAEELRSELRDAVKNGLAERDMVPMLSHQRAKA